ncbi:MAG: fibronectin type III domain-containing protein, partial [Spirosomataceae bacterium]
INREMKKYRFVLIAWSLISSLTVFGQSDEITETNFPGVILAFPTPDGNLIRILPKEESLPQFSETLKKTAYFKINRGNWFEGNEELLTIGKTERVKSAKELKSKVGDRLYQDFMKLKGFTSDKQADQYIPTEFNYDSLLNYTEQSSAFLKAFGLGFFDSEAKTDTIYIYEAVRVDVSGVEEVWGNVQIGSRVSNPLLSEIRIRQDTVLTTDSLAYFTFSVQFPENPELQEEYPLFEDINETTPEGYLAAYRIQAKKLTSYLNTRSLTPETIKFSLFIKKNDEADWNYIESQLPSADSLGNLKLYAYIEAEPEDKISVKFLPEDYAGAIGKESDVYSAYAISKGTVPLIYGVNGKDSTNCIVLNWDKLPLKPFYAGILVERSQGENPVEQLAILDAEATQFEDYAIEPGLIYNYSIRALFPEKQNVKQEMPASVSLSGNSVAPPLPPFNLTVDTTATTAFPTLRWEASESKSRFGYIVYTGLTPTELSPMPGIVKENFLVDSVGVYSGKLTYYFAVLEQNILQDTSAFSNIVSFKPKLPVSFISPSYVTANLINNDVLLEWQELRERDEYVAGYQVQRRKVGEETFERISPEVLGANTFMDTTFVRGTAYEYRVASVSIEREVGVFSMASEINFPLDPLDPPTKLDIQNTSDGIMIKWPAVEEGRVKEYVVYRGTSLNGGLTEVARVPSGRFQYEDTAVESSSNYIYAVSIVDSSNQEGLKSNKKSINRIAPKTL